MKLKTLASVLFAAASFGAAAQGADWLITPKEALEFKGAEAFDAPPMLRARAVNPRIDIVTPSSPTEKLKAPFPIQIKFQPEGDAAIVPTTFKVMYGMLNIDITERLLKYAKVTAEGVSFDKAQVPAGKHRLTLQVADEKQRVAQRELKIEVE